MTLQFEWAVSPSFCSVLLRPLGSLAETVATKHDVRELRDEMHIEIRTLRSEIVGLDHKIEVAVRDLTIRMGAIAIVLFGTLASIKFFG